MFSNDATVPEKSNITQLLRDLRCKTVFKKISNSGWEKVIITFIEEVFGLAGRFKRCLQAKMRMKKNPEPAFETGVNAFQDSVPTIQPFL